jgi:ABC-type polysaccharide/polyol phosphate transport system ATPase subunit
MRHIELNDVGKQYVKYDDTPMLVNRLRFRNRTKRSKLWAVRHVDLNVDEGECVGIIGRNGSGKSTLLQMVAGTTRPSEGLVTVSGRVAPLISVGVGFHPELTGMENVYLNGMILGMSRKDLDRRVDEIVEFSEVADFINTPVKFYSSGMTVRLGFSVAIHVEPEVLLVDEVLAVGDFPFQLKCFERMDQIRNAGTTILVVTHNLNAVRRLCDRAVLLHDGTHRFTGATEEAISLFHEVADESREIEDDGAMDSTDGVEHGVAEIESVSILDADGRPTANVRSNEHMTVRMQVRFERDCESPLFGLAVVTDKGVPVYSDNSPQGSQPLFRAGSRVTIDMTLDTALTTGSYQCTTGIMKNDHVTRLARARPLHFYVAGRSSPHGIADLRARFDVSPAAGDEDAVGRPDGTAAVSGGASPVV